jgi:hypothetical protein
MVFVTTWLSERATADVAGRPVLLHAPSWDGNPFPGPQQALCVRCGRAASLMALGSDVLKGVTKGIVGPQITLIPELRSTKRRLVDRGRRSEMAGMPLAE